MKTLPLWLLLVIIIAVFFVSLYMGDLLLFVGFELFVIIAQLAEMAKKDKQA